MFPSGAGSIYPSVQKRLYLQRIPYHQLRPVRQTSHIRRGGRVRGSGRIFQALNYPVVGEEGHFVEIANHPSGTLLGDTAVAVNLEDERYQGSGKRKDA